MDCEQAIRTRRSIRRFKAAGIPRDVSVGLVECGRCAPSAANRQPLEFLVVDNRETTKDIFEQLMWAGYVRPKRNPPAGKEPVVYIVVLIDTARALAEYASVDAAAATENMILAAWSKGIGSCWLGSINRDNVRRILGIPDRLMINSVIALGYPDEEPIMEDTEDACPDAVRYYLDEQDVLHVPKRSVRSICHINKYGRSVSE